MNVLFLFLFWFVVLPRDYIPIYLYLFRVFLGYENKHNFLQTRCMWNNLRSWMMSVTVNQWLSTISTKRVLFNRNRLECTLWKEQFMHHFREKRPYMYFTSLRSCCSQSESTILKILESSAPALFLYNCTPNTLRVRERRLQSRARRIDWLIHLFPGYLYPGGNIW